MFTKAEFLSNEDNNYHTENGVEMANNFGTEEEQRLMMQIQKDHYARGHINPDEIEARMGIVKKYWHMLESNEESIEEDDEERGAEYYREKDKQHTDYVKAELEEIMSHLDQAITYRYKNSHLFFNSGDKAGTGEMYRMADKLKELHDGWDKSTELYGM
jgi:hypothetical protein